MTQDSISGKIYITEKPVPVSIGLELLICPVEAETPGDFKEEGVGEPVLSRPRGRDL